jgi:GT2 family glycosyltransferase
MQGKTKRKTSISFQSGSRVNKDKVELSIVIVTYNSIRFIDHCLHSLFRTRQNCTFDVWIIDNNSEDGTQQAIKKYPVHLIKNDSNFGFSKAVNIGIARSKAPFVLLLNDDTELHDHVLDELVAFLKNTPQAAVVAPRIILPDGQPEPFGLKFPGLIKEFFHANPAVKSFVQPIMNARQKKSRAVAAAVPCRVDLVTGACFLVRRTVIEQIGSLDENYFIYVEEVDWCWRIKHAGWEIYSYPMVSIIHYFGQATKQKPTQQTVNWILPHRYFSILYFFKKNYHIVSYQILRLIVIQGFSTRLLYYWIANQFCRGKYNDTIKHIIAIISIAWRGI